MFCNGLRRRIGRIQLMYNKNYQSELVLFTVGVSKKEFRSSVLRNRVKRLLREVFRSVSESHSNPIEPGEYFLLYQSSELPTYESLKYELLNLLQKIDY